MLSTTPTQCQTIRSDKILISKCVFQSSHEDDNAAGMGDSEAVKRITTRTRETSL